MKSLITLSIMLIITALIGCETTSADITAVSSKRSSRVAARIITATKFAFAPDTEVWVYNQSTAPLTVEFYYNNTTLSTGWVLAETKTVASRKDALYCRLGVKQLKAVVTYDQNAGTFQFLNARKYSCK